MYNIVLFLILLFIVLDFAIERTLAWLNEKKIGISIPKELSGIYDDEKYKKQQQYSLVNHKFGVLSSSFDFAILVIMFSFGLFGVIDDFLRLYIENEILFTVGNREAF